MSAETIAPATSTVILTSAQCAKRLGLREQSLRLKRFNGQGPPYFRWAGPTSRVAYRAADVDAWIAARPTYGGTHEERAAAHAAKKAASPKRRRRRKAVRS